MVSYEYFDRKYQKVVDEIYSYWTESMQFEISAHCYGWAPGMFDFERYLRASSIRFYTAYQLVEKFCGPQKRICDVGGFWGVFPVIMKQLGFNVTMTESMKFYSSSFKNLFGFISDNGVDIIDYDPFEMGHPHVANFDFITVLAIIEHYPHSLKIFVENITSMITNGGRIYLDVPNLAYWPNRIKLLHGKTPLTSLKSIYLSKVPFTGHHHEMTIEEIRDLAELGGFEIECELFFNYTMAHVNHTTRFWWWMRNPVMMMAFYKCPNSRECLGVLCRKSSRD